MVDQVPHKALTHLALRADGIGDRPVGMPRELPHGDTGTEEALRGPFQWTDSANRLTVCQRKTRECLRAGAQVAKVRLHGCVRVKRRLEGELFCEPLPVFPKLLQTLKARIWDNPPLWTGRSRGTQLHWFHDLAQV
jgi:hypothetical protein